MTAVNKSEVEPPAETGPTNESLTNLKRDRDGYFARFSHHIFGDPSGFFGKFADAQRLERLDGCKALEGDLAECERVREAMLSSASADVSSEGAYSTGASGRRGQSLKIARFYGWGVGGSGASDSEREEEARVMGQQQQQHDQNTDEAASKSESISTPSCSREAHSVWACRALALGCADHLVPLRKCLRETKSDGLYYDNADVSPLEGECVLEQGALAKCVALNTAELERRFKSRE